MCIKVYFYILQIMVGILWYIKTLINKRKISEMLILRLNNGQAYVNT